MNCLSHSSSVASMSCAVLLTVASAGVSIEVAGVDVSRGGSAIAYVVVAGEEEVEGGCVYHVVVAEWERSGSWASRSCVRSGLSVWMLGICGRGCIVKYG